MNTQNDELIMLWREAYYDIPLSGLARYNGKEVYFKCINEGCGYVDIDQCPEELRAIINNKQNEANYMIEYNDYYIIKYKDEEEDYDEIIIEQMPIYNLYELSDNDLTDFKNLMELITTNVGSHCWYLKEKYKRFDANEKPLWQEFHKSDAANFKVDISRCQLIRTVKRSAFKNFNTLISL